ncbi:MAG TPA: glycosyltransferase family 87 protein [Gammaproteobacteria bacterium]|nr:glycosyltransferase family 87 protein [Gammaproteobacteria bacterium]
MEEKFSQQKLAWLLWIIFTIGICILITATGNSHTVSLNYWLAGNHWLQGKPLYSLKGAGFIYFPQSAILYTPLALLPFALSEICWRVISLAVFALGLNCFASMLKHSAFNQVRIGTSYQYIKSQGFFFLLLTIITLPLAFSSARNGQMHLVLCGMLLGALYKFSLRQWWKSAGLLLIAFALKPTAIVLLLMLGALYWAMGWRLFVGLLALVLLPFFTQSSSYVWHQYTNSIMSFQMTVEGGSYGNWAQVFNALSQFGLVMSQNLQTVIRLILAVGIFCLGYLIKRRYSLNEVALWIFVLSICYLLLFNPRTESNGYFMLAPAIGFIMSRAIVRKQYLLVSSLVLYLVLTFLGYYITRALTPGHPAWLDPLLGSLFFVLVLIEIFKMLFQKKFFLATNSLSP